MNKDCKFCQKIGAPSREKLYEDSKIVVMLSDEPSAYGHIIVMPKEHYPIVEQTPDFIVDHVFKVANKVSIVLFEVLKLQGTNLLVNNGIAAGQESAHFMVSVIPRKEDDGLNMQWPTKQLSEEEMSTVELQLKEQAKSIGGFQKEKEAPLELKKKTETIPQKGKEGESYLLKQWRKMP